MTDQSPILALPYILPSQAQKHVTHNEAVRLLDLLVQLTVTSDDRTDGPAAAPEGERHIVGAGATGAWAGHDGEITLRENGVWQFFEPQAGWRAVVAERGQMVIFDGSAWAPVSGAVPDRLQNLVWAGIGTSADANNTLAVAGPGTLLTHAGSDHQLKLNKASAGDTGSLLFQTGYGGRAEMGCAGTDDFSVKVSADGSTWAEAMRIDAGTAQATIPDIASGTVEIADILRLVPGLTADLPGAVDAGSGAMAFASDLSGGPAPVYSDGTVWRRMDGTAV
ncbi:DUF2793 domain-containing protein [Aestuariibius insulae]|uniref:DUF2793 domain-containing protein n=1 Tax=Aestuariibius insulae TaxID=2058287 RepID=UPI00345E07B4